MALLTKPEKFSRETGYKEGMMMHSGLLKQNFRNVWKTVGKLHLELQREIKICDMNGSISTYWMIWKIISISSTGNWRKKQEH